MKLAEATELWLLERTRKLPSVVSVGSSSTSPRVASVTSSAPPSRNSCFSSSAEAAVSSSASTALPVSRVAVQDLEAVDVHRSGRLVGQARRLEVRPLRHPVRRHCEVHLGSAPGTLVAHEAAVEGVVDVVCLGHVHHEGAEPVAAGEEELSARGQVVGAHDVPRVHRQGQGVAVHAHCARGVRGQDHAAAAAGANRPV